VLERFLRLDQTEQRQIMARCRQEFQKHQRITQSYQERDSAGALIPDDDGCLVLPDTFAHFFVEWFEVYEIEKGEIEPVIIGEYHGRRSYYVYSLPSDVSIM